jgi:hypothetical protein
VEIEAKNIQKEEQNGRIHIIWFQNLPRS